MLARLKVIQKKDMHNFNDPSDMSVTSVANDKGDNEMIPGAMHRSGISLTAEENSGKPPGGELSYKSYNTSVFRNQVLMLSPNGCI